LPKAHLPQARFSIDRSIHGPGPTGLFVFILAGESTGGRSLEIGRAKGDHFEAIAATYLGARGFAVLARNYRDGPREIDLVVRRGDLVAFVEVKGRSRSDFGHPFSAIDRAKRREVSKAAAAWARLEGRPRFAYRFDAVAVLPDGQGGWRVEHLEDAWRRGE
jgi:putative endonuclease